MAEAGQEETARRVARRVGAQRALPCQRVHGVETRPRAVALAERDRAVEGGHRGRVAREQQVVEVDDARPRLTEHLALLVEPAGRFKGLSIRRDGDRLDFLLRLRYADGVREEPITMTRVRQP